MSSKQTKLDSDSSDDDYYDNFEKYKQKHKMAQPRKSSFSSSVNDKGVRSLGKGSTHALKAVSSAAEQSKEVLSKPSMTDFDAELAELLAMDSPPCKISKPVLKTRDTIQELDDVPIPLPINDLHLSNNGAVQKDLMCDRTDNFDDSIEYERRCTIVLRDSRDGHLVVRRCAMEDSFHKIMKDCADQIKIGYDKMIFMGKDRRYYPDQTPLSVGLDENDPNEIDVLESYDSTADVIEIKWLLKGKKPILAKILLRQTFRDLKENFCNEYKLDPKKTQLVFDSDKLQDDATPESMEIEDGDCVDVYVNE